MSIRKRNMSQNRAVAFISAVLLALVMLVMMIPANVFAAENAAVTSAKNGVVQVNVHFDDGSAKPPTLIYGSGFLVNDNTIVTCAHVLTVDTAAVAKALNTTEAEVSKRIKYSVTVGKDVTVPAKLVNSSIEDDWAVITIDKPINGTTPLKLRRTSTLKQTEPVWAIGFPDDIALMKNLNKYTSEDTSVRDGAITDISDMQNIFSSAVSEYVVHNIGITTGFSGGPLVDEQGNVIGINQGSYRPNKQTEWVYLSVALNDDVLNTIGNFADLTIVDAEAPAEEPTEEETETAEQEPAPAAVVKDDLEKAYNDAAALKEEDYSKETYTEFKTALENAKATMDNTNATQEDVDSALSALNDAQGKLAKKTGLDMKWIIIIAAAVVVIAAVIIIIVVVTSKKKKQQKAANKIPSAGPKTVPMGGQQPQGFTPPQPPQQPQGFTPVSPVAPANDAGETTVLSADAGETTILSQNINGGTLVSAKTGEKVKINTAEFTIGRERSKVNYCISGNTSVGRTHAKIVTRNGQSYLVDMKATNGTFVNGVKCTPMEEVLLKNGDKIAFSNEEYTYQA